MKVGKKIIMYFQFTVLSVYRIARLLDCQIARLLKFWTSKSDNHAVWHFSTSIILLLITVSGCGSKRDPQIELIQDMMQSPAIEPQDYDEKKPGSLAMRQPPEGAIPKGHRPYNIKTSEKAEELLFNPLPRNFDTLQRGQKMYYIYCGVCHGSTGTGDGPVAAKTLLKPPSLVNQKIKDWADGGIYHMITVGRGLMGSFASQIPNEEDRWALVHFIRRLQAHAKEEDTPKVNEPPTEDKNNDEKEG